MIQLELGICKLLRTSVSVDIILCICLSVYSGFCQWICWPMSKLMLMWCCHLRRAGRDKEWRCVLFSGPSVPKGAWHETSYSLFLYDIVYF